jgi:hypothetical protein
MKFFRTPLDLKPGVFGRAIVSFLPTATICVETAKRRLRHVHFAKLGTVSRSDAPGLNSLITHWQKLLNSFRSSPEDA